MSRTEHYPLSRNRKSSTCPYFVFISKFVYNRENSESEVKVQGYLSLEGIREALLETYIDCCNDDYQDTSIANEVDNLLGELTGTTLGAKLNFIPNPELTEDSPDNVPDMIVDPECDIINRKAIDSFMTHFKEHGGAYLFMFGADGGDGFTIGIGKHLTEIKKKIIDETSLGDENDYWTYTGLDIKLPNSDY